MRRLAVVLFAVAVSATFAAPAAAFAPGTGGQLYCLDMLRDLFSDDRSCITDRDCMGDNVCVEHVCTSPKEIDDWGDLGQYAAPIIGDPIPDDGGADEACGADRRCRIERLAHRNRLLRQYQAAHQERLVRDETRQLLEEREPETNREADPWSLGFQRHQFGLGLSGAWTYAGHFRPEATLVFQDSRGTTHDGDLRTRQDATFLTTHVTYLPSPSWFSPLVSVGFGMGWGEMRLLGSRARPGVDVELGSNPSVHYHFVTAAVGAEAQFGFGLFIRLAYRHGRLLYNQVRYEAGEYDERLREDYREFMHDEQLGGFDFTLGWAF